MRLAALAADGRDSSGDSTVAAEEEDGLGGGDAAAEDDSALTALRESASEFDAPMMKSEHASGPTLTGIPTADPLATAAFMPVDPPSAGSTGALLPNEASFRVPAPYGAHAHAAMARMPYVSTVQMPSADLARLQAPNDVPPTARGATPFATRPVTPRREDDEDVAEDDRISHVPSSPSSHGSSECTVEHGFNRGSSVELHLTGGDRKADDTASSYGGRRHPYPTPDAVRNMLPDPCHAIPRAVDTGAGLHAPAHGLHLMPPAIAGPIAGAGAKLAPGPLAPPTNAPPAQFQMPKFLNGTYTTRDIVERTVRMLMAAVPQAYHPPGCELAASLQPACQVPPIQAPFFHSPAVAHHHHRSGAAHGQANPMPPATVSGFVPHIPGAMALMAQMAARQGLPSSTVPLATFPFGEQPPQVPGGHAANLPLPNYAQVAPAPPMPSDPCARRALEAPPAKRAKPTAQNPKPLDGSSLATENPLVSDPAPNGKGVMVTLDSLDLCHIFEGAGPENDDLFEGFFRDDC